MPYTPLTPTEREEVDPWNRIAVLKSCMESPPWDILAVVPWVSDQYCNGSNFHWQ